MWRCKITKGLTHLFTVLLVLRCSDAELSKFPKGWYLDYTNETQFTLKYRDFDNWKDGKMFDIPFEKGIMINDSNYIVKYSTRIADSAFFTFIDLKNTEAYRIQKNFKVVIDNDLVSVSKLEFKKP